MPGFIRAAELVGLRSGVDNQLSSVLNGRRKLGIAPRAISADLRGKFVRTLLLLLLLKIHGAPYSILRALSNYMSSFFGGIARVIQEDISSEVSIFKFFIFN